LHRPDEVVNAYEMAASLAPTAAERNFLAGQARLLSSP
jgi:predicted RNA polymerase sigma factor